MAIIVFFLVLYVLAFSVGCTIVSIGYIIEGVVWLLGSIIDLICKLVSLFR